MRYGRTGMQHPPSTALYQEHRYERDTYGYEPIRLHQKGGQQSSELANDFGITGEHMGGVFSGNRRPRLAKQKTTCLPEVKLTMARLYSTKRDGGPTICPYQEGWAMVRWGHKEWPALLDHTPLHLGGERRWLVCPKCRARRQSLFIASDTLVCRKCLHLKYESQSESVRYRNFRKADKIRAKLGWLA